MTLLYHALDAHNLRRLLCRIIAYQTLRVTRVRAEIRYPNRIIDVSACCSHHAPQAGVRRIANGTFQPLEHHVGLDPACTINYELSSGDGSLAVALDSGRLVKQLDVGRRTPPDAEPNCRDAVHNESS